MSDSSKYAREPLRLLQAAASAMPDGAIMTREQAQALVAKVVKMSKADDIIVGVNSTYQADLRFAANQMSTSGGVMNAQMNVQSTFGKKHAVAVTNDMSDESLRRTVEQSEALAKLSPDDPENMPALGPQTYLPVSGYVDSTANLSPADRARAALTALEPARKAGDLKASGFLIVNAGANALGNNRGLFAYNRATTANYTLTVRTNDGTGSGWVGAEHPDWTKLDFGGLAARAIAKARLSRNPVA
ncbi:MAG: TldD/PmbA family protein, partial [Gemmatimonadaceae bacterium]